jgi:hypothetical protein
MQRYCEALVDRSFTTELQGGTALTAKIYRGVICVSGHTET